MKSAACFHRGRGFRAAATPIRQAGTPAKAGSAAVQERASSIMERTVRSLVRVPEPGLSPETNRNCPAPEVAAEAEQVAVAGVDAGDAVAAHGLHLVRDRDAGDGSAADVVIGDQEGAG